VNLRDVRVIERRECLRFARKSRQPMGIGRKDIRQDLDRDVAIQLRITRAMDFAHPACPERAEDLVRTEFRSRRKHQAVLTRLCRVRRW
jgi:hypothetical protein